MAAVVNTNGVARERRLTIAMPKGRLTDDALAFLTRAGYATPRTARPAASWCSMQRTAGCATSSSSLPTCRSCRVRRRGRRHRRPGRAARGEPGRV